MDVKIKKFKHKYKVGCPYCDLSDDDMFDFYRDKFCDGCENSFYTIMSKDDIMVNLILVED